MKNFKKVRSLVCFLLILVLIVSVQMPAFALSNKVFFEVSSFGIIDVDENGVIDVARNVSRAEFTKILVTLVAGKNVPLAADGDSGFYDVGNDNEYAKYISFALGMGIITMPDDRCFRPDDYITWNESVKMMVSALGYNEVAQSRGGYPQGYLLIASNLGLNDNISQAGGSAVTMGNVINLIYNSLEVEILEPDYNMDDIYLKSGTTFKSQFLETEEMVKFTGTVTANHYTWLIEPNRTLNFDEIELNGMVMNVGNTNATDYIGQDVEVYCANDGNDYYTILNIAPTKKNSVVAIYDEQGPVFRNTYLEYINESDELEKVEIDSNAMYVYNNRPLTVFDDNSKIIEDGYYKLIDNNGDESYDYVFIFEYDSAVVSRVNSGGGIFLKDGREIDNRSYVVVDEDSDITYKLLQKDGTNATVTDISEDDVVSVMRSTDGLFVQIYVSKDSVTGVYELSNNDEVTIDGNIYKLYDEKSMGNVSVGTVVKAYLNHNDEVVRMVEDQSNAQLKYGYVMGTDLKKFGKTSIRILLPGSIEFESETDIDLAEDTETSISVLLCQNSAEKIYEVKETLVVSVEDIDQDGNITSERVKMTDEEFIDSLENNVPIGYKLNSEGKISEAEILAVKYGTKDTRLTYNAKDRVFGGISVYNGFGIDESTKVICIPTSDDATTEDIMSKVKIDNRDSSVKYLVTGYGYNEDTQCVKLLCITIDMSSNTITNITKNSNIGIVMSKSEVIDESGNEYTKTNIFTGGKAESYLSKDITAANGDLMNVKGGDFILYSLSPDEYLVNAKIICSLDDEIDFKWSNMSAVNECVTGIVTDVRLREINNEKSRRVHRIMLETGNTSNVVELYARNSPDVYIYTKSSGAVVTGTINDIVPGDIVCITRPMGETVRESVIIR